MALPLSPSVFAIFTHLIEEKAGLHYDAGESGLLAEKLTVRAVELGFDSLLDYYYFLRYDDGGARELDALLESLVVHETYFFRESDQLRALVGQLGTLAAERGTARIRIWCAAASSGEEPLTLAMMLAERDLLDRVEIVATDISARILAKAAAGKYAGRSLRALGDGERRRYFYETDGGLLRVREEIHSRIRWQRLNLFDPDGVAALGRFDVILSRNVLIYFQDDTVIRLVARFAQALVPRGLLLVGASESLLRFGTAFDCEEHAGAFFYRKNESLGEPSGAPR
jgi:chemotaxis protein methyltransferase CheR